MVDHDRQVSLTFTDRDLIEPEALKAGEQVDLALRLSADSLADPSDCPPRDPHQRADRRLGRVHRQPCTLVLKRSGESSVVACPRDRRDDHPVTLALDPWRIRLDVRELRAEIQRPPPPATVTQVIAGAAPPAVRAAIPLAVARADRHHHLAVLGGVDRLDDRLLQPQPPDPGSYPYASVAHAATAHFQRGSDLQTARTLGAPRRAHPKHPRSGCPAPGPHCHTSAAGRRAKRRHKALQTNATVARTTTPTNATLDA
jgi:hypothetical protein